MIFFSIVVFGEKHNGLNVTWGSTCVNEDMQLEMKPETNFLYEIKQYLRELESKRRGESMLP